MNDDTLKDSPELTEALRRLPRDVAEERQYRITRALYLSMRHEILPKEEWTTYDTVPLFFVITVLPYLFSWMLISFQSKHESHVTRWQQWFTFMAFLGSLVTRFVEK